MPRQMTQIGKLDQKITLYHRGLTGDGMGGATQALVAYATSIWASVLPLSGQEVQASMRTEAVRRYTVRFRYRGDVRETDVVQWRGRQMNIIEILDAGPRPIYLELECELGARI